VSISAKIGATGRLAGAAALHPWRTVGAWVAAIVVSMVVIGALLAGALTTQTNFTGTPESQRALNLYEQRLGHKQPILDVVIVQSATRTVDDAAFRARVDSLASRLAAVAPGVITVAPTYYAAKDPTLVSQDRHSTLIPLSMPGSVQNDAHVKIAPVLALADSVDGQDGFHVLVTGDATLSRDYTILSQSDLQTGEMVGIPIALIILLAVFGTAVAALVPLLLAVCSIIVALGLAALVGQVSPLSFFVVNMLTLMGLAVGIDYSLFIVSRYREERRAERVKLEAIMLAGNTAGRAVFFSGMTVVLALIGLLIVPMTVFFSLATGAILAVLVSVVGAMTLLPAVLSLLGDRIERWRVPYFGRRAAEPAGAGGVWARIAHGAMARPVLSVVCTVVVLLAAALPYLRINTGSSGVSSLPSAARASEGFQVLNRDFNAGRVSPAFVVIDGATASPQAQQAYRRLQVALARDARFGPFKPAVDGARRFAVLEIPVAGDATSDSALNGVRDLRRRYLPDALQGTSLRAYVGGASASNIDYFAITDQYLPIVFALVLGLSFILLTVAFRSVVVPVSSIAMNLLSVGAAYGLLVLVSQRGHGASLLGLHHAPVVEAWIPLFLFSVLFGLSMDYQVFLLSRIRERYDQRGDSREAVAYGIGSTARLITGAAVIMVAVFAGFAAGELVMFQQMGFGLGVAILIDATLVRTILMPAWMRLLGERSWYLPPFLEWLPDLRVEPTDMAPTVPLAVTEHIPSPV
jgi:RND superfamily putative drug exporter